MRTTGKEKWIVADYVRISDTHLLNIVRDITSQKRRQQVDEAERSKIELLRQAMAAFTSVMNLNHVLKQVMEYLKLLIPYDRALLYLLDKNELEIAAAGGFGDNSPLIGRRIPTRNPQFEAINRNRYPLYLNNAETYRPFQELGDLNCGKAWLGVPLLGHGQLIGYLSIYSASSGLYGGNETDLAQTFANEAAIAIENARLFQQVMQFAITDSLTGFYNRRYFYELAEIELRRSRRYRSDLSLMMIDIDFFKQVNDRLGHTMGDQVLVQLSECLRAQIRDSDSIGRYGGEEFVILMPETNLNQAAEAAERLRRAIEICSTIVDHSEVQVTISLGIAQMDETCANIDDLFRRADRALYHAKQTGRNRVCVWSETMGV
ncbi:MAG: sensor domain-containing diguanylate cyclase [Bellilinea sp.]